MQPATTEHAPARALGAPLAWALSRILPGPEETLLLRTVLLRGPSAAEAWSAFRERIDDLQSLFRTDTGGRKRLSPLLLASIRDNGLDADPALLTVLRTAHLREDLRTGIYRSIAGAACTALRERGSPFLVLKGAALGATVYADPSLRHAHDIDLLVPPDALPEAERALEELGLQGPRALPWDQGTEFRHVTELPILLLSRPFRVPFYRAPFDTLAARSETVTDPVLGRVAVLDPIDALLLALGHASYCPGRSNLSWAIDAWTLLHARAVDGTALVDRAVDMRLELPLLIQLDWLRRRLDAPVPDGVVEALAERIGSVESLRRDVALFGARQAAAPHPDLGGPPRPRGLERARMLAWELMPSRAYLSWAYDDPPPWSLPAIYLSRPFTAAADRLKWWVLRRMRRRAPGGG